MNKIYIYNWYHLRDNCLLKVKKEERIILLEKGIKKSGNLNLLASELGFSSPSFYNLYNHKIELISVKKLKKLLSFLDLNYNSINEKIVEIRKGNIASIKNPILPFNVYSVDFAYLLGCVVSDGTIYIDKKSRNVLRLKYSSNDNESISMFEKAINNVFGEVYIQKEIINTQIYLKIGSSIISETLVAFGAHVGNKTSKNLPVPYIIEENYFLINSYLKAIYGDEGSFAGGEKYFPYITLSRCSHLNHLFEKIDLDNFYKNIVPLMKERQFPTGHKIKSISFPKIRRMIRRELREKIYNDGLPQLLIGEKILLKKLEIESRLWISRISLTEKGKISLTVALIIRKKRSILKFYKEVGFSLIRKQTKLKKCLEEVKWICN
ncbi:MAG: hypothetical protein ISS01_00015 [Nanoarchaeota archaeon]|nr:hypothetical protein [Nanoarchaeota archaeon]